MLAIVAVPVRIFDEQGLPRYQALKEELRVVEAVNRRFDREARELKEEVEALRTDPSALEQIARDELGMAKPGELIFQFPN